MNRDDDYGTGASSAVAEPLSSSSSSVVAASPPRRSVVVNPYAQQPPKKPPAATTTSRRRPLHRRAFETTSSSSSSSSSHDTSVASIQKNPPSLDAMTVTAAEENKKEGGGWLLFDDPLRYSLQQQQRKAPTPPVVMRPQSFSVNLPAGQRLPSRNLSFGSAEILTVPELCERMMMLLLLLMLPRGNDGGTETTTSPPPRRSVRVTGTVRHKLTAEEDGTVSLVLGDPLAELLAPNKTPAKRRTSARPWQQRQQTFSSTAVAAKRPAGASSVGRRSLDSQLKTPAAPCKTPATAAATTTTTTDPAVAPAATTSFLRQKKRKRTSFVFKRRSVGGLGGGGGGSSSRVPSKPTKDPVEATAEALAGGNCVWVVVDHPAQVAVSEANAGDLVMVMGEIQQHMGHDTDEERDAEGSTLNGTSCAVVRDVMAELLKQQQKSGSSCPTTGSYLQARILRNVNGTNMRLHTQALQERRAFLQREQRPAIIGGVTRIT